MSETYRKELSKTFPLGAIARPLILIISFYKVLKGKSKRLQSFQLSKNVKEYKKWLPVKTELFIRAFPQGKSLNYSDSIPTPPPQIPLQTLSHQSVFKNTQHPFCSSTLI